jgi:hypothetical protein
MSLATLPKSRAYVVVTYTAIDEKTLQFETLKFRVSPEVAAVLADEGPELGGMTFTDLAERMRRREDDDGEPRRTGQLDLDPEVILRGVARRVRKRRLMETGYSAWEGPRPPRFTRIIGATEIWSGPPKRFQFCHGRRLRPGEICLDCNRAAREQAPPEVEEPTSPTAYHGSGRLKGGLRGKR